MEQTLQLSYRKEKVFLRISVVRKNVEVIKNAMKGNCRTIIGECIHASWVRKTIPFSLSHPKWSILCLLNSLLEVMTSSHLHMKYDVPSNILSSLLKVHFLYHKIIRSWQRNSLTIYNPSGRNRITCHNYIFSRKKDFWRNIWWIFVFWRRMWW